MGIFDFSLLTYEELSAIYGGFAAPVMKVLVNDNILTLALSALTSNTGLGLMTDGVSVTLNKDTASSASFNLVNCYSLFARSFTKQLYVGAKIAIMLGYGSVIRPVFAGYVDELSYEFSENPVVRVRCFDGIKLMQDTGKVQATWDDGDFYTETIMEIMSKYSDICSLPVINVLPSLKTQGHIEQRNNDYDFIKNSLCKYCDRDLIINSGIGFLVNPYVQFGRLTNLGYGQGLLSLSVKSGYKKVKVAVTGDKLKNAYAETSVSTGASYKSSMNKPQIISTEAPLKTSADCMVLAKRLAHDAVSSVRTASGSCVGLPDIIPGVGLGFDGVELSWSGRTYFVDTVTHTFNSSGFTTSFTTKGWT